MLGELHAVSIARGAGCGRTVMAYGERPAARGGLCLVMLTIRKMHYGQRIKPILRLIAVGSVACLEWVWRIREKHVVFLGRGMHVMAL